MELNNHLLYIDVTQVCGIGCDFCMYDQLHDKNSAHLKISPKAKRNLERLSGDDSLQRISISGEGEPLNNTEAIWGILECTGGVPKEIITSGFWDHRKFIAFARDLQKKADEMDDSYNLRLSTDSYHIPKLKHIPQGRTIRFSLDEQPSNLSLSFRSIWCDKEYTRAFLLNQVTEYGLRGEIEGINELDDVLHVKGVAFPITYKNLVNPDQCSRKDYLSLENYVRAMEIKKGKPFTLGNMTPEGSPNGLDITVKPGGDVFLYGLEIRPLGNIHHDQISIDRIRKIVEEDNVFRKFYSTPFLELIGMLGKNEEAEGVIRSANNPYWVVKSLYESGKVDLEQALV